MKAIYHESGIQLFNADCREVLPDLPGNLVVLTGPPWYENPPLSATVVNGMHHWAQAAIIQWTEMGEPPCDLPLVAVHAWVHGDQRRYQPFFHFARGIPNQESQAIVVTPEYPDHPHQFPVEVAKWLLGKLPRDHVVLDPFCGSGTVLIAAREMGREAIGIEIEEKYADIAASKLSKNETISRS